MYNLTRFCVNKIGREIIRFDRRNKGHSKWQNIKHIKGEKDAERSAIYLAFTRRMKVAIAEGKSAKPSDNSKLANIIDEAKRRNMPIASINAVLERAEKAKIKAQSEIVDFRGPGNTVFVLKLLSDNVKSFKMSLNTLFKKNACLATDGNSLSLFDHYGFVITDIKGDLDTATNDAITVGAEEVEEIEDNGKFYKFICNPTHLPKVTNLLRGLDYKIITADEDFDPHKTVTLSDDDLKRIDTLCLKLKAYDEIVSIYHNIDMTEDEDEDEVKSKV